MHMNDSIFTKIIRGDIPSHKIYEDDRVFAFLDIHPVSEGHVLVVPKTPAEFVWDMAADDYQALMAAVQKVGTQLRDVSGRPYVSMRTVGTDVPHAHVHLIPFTETRDLHHAPDMNAEPDHAALAAWAEKIKL